MTVSAEVLPSLPYYIPQLTILDIQFKIHHIQLAECDLPYCDIDILKGAEYYEMVNASLMLHDETRNLLMSLAEPP